MTEFTKSMLTVVIVLAGSAAGLALVFFIIKHILSILPPPFDDDDEDFGFMGPLRCDHCKRKRAWDDIEVFARPIPIPGGATMTRNVRYCRDSADCYAGALRIAEEFAEEQIERWSDE